MEKLGLQGCSRVDDAALAELAKWKSLKYLDVQETKVTEKGLAELRNARPGIKILSGGTPPPPPAAIQPRSVEIVLRVSAHELA